MEAAGLRVRAARDDDAMALAALVTAAYRVEAFFVEGDRTNPNDVRERMRRGEFLVLEDRDDTPVGCVYVEIRGKRGYFGMLAIAPARQGRGLGGQLVRAAEDHCARAGCREMEIEVVNLRTELPPYYRRLGYREDGITPFPDSERVLRPCHFIVMRKALT
jgi:GNAT superfamily N-acetyltransferase